jgi:hypothetical protein
MNDQHAEQRNTQSAEMQPHLDRTSRELADIERQIRDNQPTTPRS